MELFAEAQAFPLERRRRGAPLGNRNALRSGYWCADAIEVRALMRLQLRIAQVINAELVLAAAVVAVIDGKRGAATRLGKARHHLRSRNGALARAVASVERLLVDHGRTNEARDLAIEAAAMMAPLPVW